MGLFGSDANSYDKAKERVNQINTKLRQEGRLLDRQINAIEREEQKTIAMIKEAAKKNQKDVCKVYAKALVQSKRQKARIYASKAQLNSIIMQTKNQLAQMKIAGAMKSSTDVMKSMGKLIKIPEMQKTMQELSKEMMKAGIIEEMMDESIDSALGNDEADLDTVADAEVERIILEVTQGKLSTLPSVASSLPGGGASAQTAAASALEDEEEEVDEDMSKRLEALRS